MDVLPNVGCKHCLDAEPPQHIGVDPLCCCDDLFLFPSPALVWRPMKKVWFVRQKRGRMWYMNLVARISMKAKTDRTYTNSSYRPTGITNLAKA